ncbi:hypothetical protein [Demequina sp. NBRC 110056]|uniref:hypothetical protein n=1 Tax=Demequina sp. NBRC 110056 TaxID=1570345 RepID=UPI0009FE8D34|nr:hypothetical protein [Demequina sp. NBRC 110056]
MAGALVRRVSQGAGLALISDGVVGLAVPAQHAERWEKPRGLWRRGVRRVVGESYDSRAFAVAEIAVGAAIIWILPRVIGRR